MTGRRTDRRRADRRAFQPTLDGRLESRLLMSRLVKPANYPRGTPGQISTAFGGQAVEVTNSGGQSFYIKVSTGSIEAYRMPGGRFGLLVQGSGVETDLTINPLVDPKILESAHTFNTRLRHYDNLVNIGAITVQTGVINSILGYRSAILSGPIVLTGTNPVDRIAFDAIVPGASINVGGDLNTLDVLNGLTLSGPGTGIVIGRDLNSLTVGGDLVVANDAIFGIGRDQGLIPQPPKGTGPALQFVVVPTINNASTLTIIPTATAVVNGNLLAFNGGLFIVNRALQGYFLVNGVTVGIGTGNIQVRNPGGFFISRGGAV